MSDFDVQPQPGEQIHIHGDLYTFPAASGRLGGVPYEVGKAARVYQLTQGKQKFALKAFFHHYRNPQVGQNSAALAKYSNLCGLSVANRKVILPEKHADLVKKFPAFSHAVLMPWTTGESWVNYISGNKDILPENSVMLARSLAEVLSDLEKHHAAHCDISSGNFVFSPDYKHVELVDIEEMFAEGVSPPNILPVGTEGYAPEIVVQNGYHNLDADRFAGAIMLVEILAWQFADVRAEREPNSLFASGEFGYKSKRYKLVFQRLQDIPDHLGVNKRQLLKLFEQVWFARWIDQTQKIEQTHAQAIMQACPTLQEWRQALCVAELLVDEVPASDELYTPLKPLQDSQPAVLLFGLPRLHVETSLLDFGLVNHRDSRLHLKITNEGGGLLKGSVTALPWLSISPGMNFEEKPGEKSISLEFSLAPNHPTRENGGWLRFPGAIILNTNGGTKVIGVQFRVGEQSLIKKIFG